MQASTEVTGAVLEESWALFTEWKPTGYISNGPYNFTEERAVELLLHFKNKYNEKNKYEEDITRMWIQEKNTGRTLYK